MPPRRQSAASLPSHAPHGVRRGCWMNRPAGTRGEATYTALTLRSACSHSSCKLPMLGVEGDSPRVLLGVQGGDSLSRKRIPPLIRGSATGAAIPTALCAESKKRGPCFRTAPFLCRVSSRSRYCSHSHCCSRSHFRQIEVKEL